MHHVCKIHDSFRLNDHLIFLIDDISAYAESFLICPCEEDAKSNKERVFYQTYP